MKFTTFQLRGTTVARLGLWHEDRLRSLDARHPAAYLGLADLLLRPATEWEAHAEAIRLQGEDIDIAAIAFLPPIPHPGKIICVGLNYRDHTEEANYVQPAYPTLFLRLPQSWVGHGADLIRPRCSNDYDYEGELVVYIGKGGRHIAREDALAHVAGYSIANEGSVRDYQFRTPQWTLGKNFDASGSIGPWFVPAAELPPGGKGLAIQTRLNGQVVQSANTSEMVFDVATVIAAISEAMALAPGDVIVAGTPSGIGFARKPALYMQPGDTVEVEIEGIGLLRNQVAAESAAS